ncbi:MAG: tetratricopeptide repeat protein [Moorea sp. SIOASIH]|uniref:tetratricopeptide repeat protein n=1 Tax=Moorena sp. SIOASIH TaxID=2607817 RepID=UPI0013BC968D|nr:tetratricopeptide repeat protein [Moorena sp. SIOASIH]NEO41062.1 tetratricopeptide repeat protein [Moorena sp. SIOASIH]
MDKTERYPLTEREPFSESLLWRWQSQYFAKRSIDAWRQREVPYYVTSNPTISNSYARVVWAFWQERQQYRGEATTSQLTICELGAGSGTFAFHFIRRLIHLCEDSGVPPISVFRYVLSDVVAENLNWWRKHPRFSSWFEAGLLDIAHFDVTKDDEITLQVSEQLLGIGALHEPLVVIANYLFDSIPQDLYRLSKGRLERCLLSLSVYAPTCLDEAQCFVNADYSYDYEPVIDTQLYTDSDLAALVALYKESLTETNVLVPAVGWRCLKRLSKLSTAGMMMLAADKGTTTLASLEQQPLPEIQYHGSISLPVNIHALRWLAEKNGGICFVPEDTYMDLVVFVLLQTPQPMDYIETRMAYKYHLQESRPDDFYHVSKSLRQTIDQMSVRDILAYLRLSHYDSQQLVFYLPRLTASAPSLTPSERIALCEAIDRVWDSYFPMGEDIDLAYHLGCLLYEMDAYNQALQYFKRSVEHYAWTTGTAYNMALCHLFLGHNKIAKSLLLTTLKYDPANSQARELLAKISP